MKIYTYILKYIISKLSKLLYNIVLDPIKVHIYDFG